jgi:hypothetical protein
MIITKVTGMARTGFIASGKILERAVPAIEDFEARQRRIT